MANLSADKRHRTKCSVMRGLQCRLWSWCVLLLVSVNRCATQDDKKSDSPNLIIYPVEDIDRAVGQDLELFCAATKNYTADDLSFLIARAPQQYEKVNRTHIRLYKPYLKRAGRETYTCKNNKVKTNKQAIRVVRIMSRPSNVTDFNCISLNLEVLNCTWTAATNDDIITNYTLRYTRDTGSRSRPCVAHFHYNSLVRYCFWNSTSETFYRQNDAVLNFTLRGINNVGDFNQTIILDHYSVVKFAPPIDLRNVSSTAHSVLLAWKVHKNIMNFFVNKDLNFQTKIEYQIAKIDNPSYFRHVHVEKVVHELSQNEFFYNLTELPYAHHQYGVRVYIKPENASDKLWSEFSNLVIYTASEKPQKSPETIAGAFDKNAFADGRVLYIYWKQIEEYDEAGANFTYKIVITQGSKSRTYEPDRSKSLGYLSLDQTHDVETLEAMEVRIWSFNEKGSSYDNAYLYIPAEKDTRSLQLSSFTKLAYENGTYELSWSGNNNNLDNYTLFWCQHNTTNICSGRINFTVIDPERNKHTIHLPKIYRYQFALSANKGLISSGMVWAKCDISKDGIAMYDFPLHFKDHDAPGKTSVTLKWSMDCTLKEGIIRGYNISYCPVKGTSTTCDNSLGDLPTPKIIKDPKKMEATIDHLRPYTTYQFSMALETIYGLKTIENVTVRITTTEDTPTEPRNVSITDVQSDSLLIKWLVPLHLNAHSNSIKYIIHYNQNDRTRTRKYDENENMFSFKLDGLKAFTNYTISLQACNEGINSCSNRTSPIVVRTRIGAPSIVPSPLYKDNRLSWTPPDHFGGTLDGYQIRILKDAKDETLLNTTALSHELASCGGGVQNVTYEVRAFNKDTDKNHGAWADSHRVTLPVIEDPTEITFFGNWSTQAQVQCKRDSLYLLFVIMGVLFVVGAGCAVLKLYKKVRKMEDIKPEFPKELFISDKAKFPFTGMYPSEKDEKPTSDEMLLLPNSKESVPPSDIKNSENDACAPSEHTDSTGLSDCSQGPVDRQNSTSDESTHSSMQLEGRPELKNDEQGSNSSNSESDSSSENSPYFSDNKFKKNKTTGYVQPVINPGSGYVQTAPAPFKSPPPKMATQPTTSSYVMAGLPPPIFTSGVLSPSGGSHQPLPASGYVRAEDIEARNAMNFPRLGPSPTKVFGSESLPTMPDLPPPTKLGTDSSYIQLQSLDGLPSHKPTVRNTVPYKPAASSGYVRPEDAIINKHLSLLSSGQPTPVEEAAILDPAMSPDAYCRFSWSVDPSNDNLHSLLAKQPHINPSKN